MNANAALNANGCYETRESGLLLTHAGMTYRQMEARASERLLKISHSTAQRIAIAPWNAPRRFNKDLILLCADAVFTRELAAEQGIAASKYDTAAAANYFLLQRLHRQLNETPSGQLWNEAEILCLEIVRSILGDESLMQATHRGMAALHLSRNPGLHEAERTHWLHEGERNLLWVVDSIGHDYATTGGVHELLSGEGGWQAAAEVDISGVLLSTCLHGLNQAAAAQGEKRWNQFLAEIDDEGLLRQLVVRGLVLRDPEVIVNAAEAYFRREASADAHLLLKTAYGFDPGLPGYLTGPWRASYDPAFVKNALWALSSPQGDCHAV